MELDILDKRPPSMQKYLDNWGWNFNKKACEDAVSRMWKVAPGTGNKERVEPMTKSQVDEMLTRYGITLQHNKGYNAVYVANMAKADYYKSSISDEQHLARYIKDVIDDVDLPGGNVFRKYFADTVSKGEPIIWADLIE